MEIFTDDEKTFTGLLFHVARRKKGEPGSQNHVTNVMPVQSIEAI